MPHVLEPAATGRARCKACGAAIARGELRFGERVPNPYAEDKDTTLWFHPLCAAYKRPEPLLEALQAAGQAVPERERLAQAAQQGLEHRRLSRIDGAERAPGSQAHCRHCRETIARGSWRIRLVFHDEGRFAPGGYVHLECRRDYFGTDDLADRVLHFSAGLAEADREALRRALG